MKSTAHVAKEVVESVECHDCDSSVAKEDHLNYYITKVVSNARVKTPVLLTVLVYLSRVKAHIGFTHRHLAHEHVFLGTLIIAHKVAYQLSTHKNCANRVSLKYLNDATFRNGHWAAFIEGSMSKRDIDLIERQLLGILDYRLRVTEDELLALPYRPPPPSRTSVSHVPISPRSALPSSSRPKPRIHKVMLRARTAAATRRPTMNPKRRKRSHYPPSSPATQHRLV